MAASAAACAEMAICGLSRGGSAGFSGMAAVIQLTCHSQLRTMSKIIELCGSGIGRKCSDRLGRIVSGTGSAEHLRARPRRYRRYDSNNPLDEKRLPRRSSQTVNSGGDLSPMRAARSRFHREHAALDAASVDQISSSKSSTSSG
jgi:hypothetical protein